MVLNIKALTVGLNRSYFTNPESKGARVLKLIGVQ